MNSGENDKLVDSLIEVGLWKADDTGNPLDDWQSLGVVIERCEERLADDAYFITRLDRDNSPTREVYVRQGENEWRLSASKSLAVAFCNAALALSAFLEQHPECAAALLPF